jgi:CRISPR-associated protein Cas2
MMVLVTYDVETTDQGGARRLRRMAKACEDYGQRVQKSVFECMVEPAQWKVLEARLLSIMDKERDSLRVYMLGANWQRRVEHHGVRLSYTQEGPIVL